MVGQNRGSRAQFRSDEGVDECCEGLLFVIVGDWREGLVWRRRRLGGLGKMDEIGVSVLTKREEEIARTMDFVEGADEVDTGVRRVSCKDR